MGNSVLTVCSWLNIFRYLSRVTIIPFSSPSIGPESASENDAFSQLNTLIQENWLSSCIGWVISMGKMLNNDEELEEIKRELSDLVHSPRARIGWALTLYLTKQVINFSTYIWGMTIHLCIMSLYYFGEY